MIVLLRKMQVIPQPLPSIDLRRVQPWFAIRQRQEEPPAADDDGQHNPGRRPQPYQAALAHPFLRRGMLLAEAWGDTGFLGVGRLVAGLSIRQGIVAGYFI